MAMIRNIVFDFDGTLADTSKLIVGTMQKSIAEFGLPHKTEEELKAVIGIRLEEIPSHLWPELNDLGERFAANYRKNFEILKEEIPVTLFPGVKETLDELKRSGYRLTIATSRSHHSVEKLSKQLGIYEVFDYLLGGDDVLKGKPDPESIHHIAEELNLRLQETMMVGDMPVDIIMGKNAGISTCGVNYGNSSDKDLKEAGADYMIDAFPALLNILTR